MSWRRPKRPASRYFLSIGYAGCHLCQTMSRESFCDPATAALLNENYIPVLVDRELRPDIDQLYQSAANLMGHGGGWPLSMFLDSKGRPFLVGSYLPNEERQGQPALSRVLNEMIELYRDRPEDAAKSTEPVFESLANFLDRDMHGPAEAMQLDLASMRFGQRFDIFLGGSAGALKASSPSVWKCCGGRTCVRASRNSSSSSTRPWTRRCWAAFTIISAEAFFAMSADERWLVPHVEKMLAENASIDRISHRHVAIQPQCALPGAGGRNHRLDAARAEDGSKASPRVWRPNMKARKANSISGPRRRLDAALSGTLSSASSRPMA